MRKLRFTLMLLAVFLYSNLHSQCQNEVFGEEIAAPTSETPSIMSTCNSTDEYNKVTNIEANRTYKVVSTGGEGNYISIFKDGNGNELVKSGASPLIVKSEEDGDWYISFTTTSLCEEDTDCHQTSISRYDGCLGLSQFGNGTAPVNSTPQNISTCLFTGEYSKIVGFDTENTYIISVTGGFPEDYLTIREGTFDGPIITAGQAPLTYNPTSSADIFVHLSGNENCEETGGCRTLTITCSTCCTPEIAIEDGSGNEASGVICEGESVTLIANQADSYLWNNGATSQSITVSPISYTSYNVITEGGVCPGTAYASVQVVPYPTFNIFANSELCVGETLNLSATGNYSYHWTGPNGFNSTDQNPSVLVTDESYAGIYIVTATNDICSSTLSIDVTVSPRPIAEITADTIFCVGDTIDLFASESNFYSWTGPQGFQSDIQNPSIPNTGIANTGTYQVTLTNSANCSSSASLFIEVASDPDIMIDSNSPFCEGDTLKLTATGGETYHWTGPNDFESNEQNPMIINTTINDSGEYTVIGYSIYGCSATKTKTVFVIEAPYQEEINVTEEEWNTFTFSIENDGNAYQYFWDFGDGQFSGTPIPTHTYAEDGIYVVSLTMSNSCGSKELTTTVEVLTELGINKYKEDAFLKVFPNPADKGVTLNYGGPNQVKQFFILNELGQLITTQSVLNNMTTIDVSTYSAGMYFVKVQLEKGNWVYSKFSVVK